MRLWRGSVCLLVFALAGCQSAPKASIKVDGSQSEIAVGMDKEAIRKTIRLHLRDVRSCYEVSLKDTPNLAGKVILEWDIGDLGKVTKVTVIRSLNTQVDECLATSLKSWTFPVPPDKTIGRVRYPFVFSPN